MIRAYPESYLHKAQALLGDAFDYAINVLEMDGSAFVKMFIGSTISKRLELGEPAYLQGKSGIDVIVDVIEDTMGTVPQIIPQWYSDRKYGEILAAVPFETLLSLYPTLHEADISKFADTVDKQVREYFPETNLKRIRQIYGCSQAELARRSGVGLRSIQMYEQRNKDINKASVEAVYRLAKVLGCSVEDLIEK